MGKRLSRTTLEYIDPDRLKISARGIHRKDGRKISKLSALMDRYGFCVPVIVNGGDLVLIDGRCRVLANRMRSKPQRRIPAVVIEAGQNQELLSVALNNPELQAAVNLNNIGEIARRHGADVFSSNTGFEKKCVADMLSRMDENIPAPRSQPDRNEVEDEKAEDKVTVIFEMPRESFVLNKKKLDTIIRQRGINSFVRIDGEKQSHVRKED